MIYLDHNASTPVRPEVADAMLAALRELPGNPSSSHAEGQRARAAVERAREQVAALMHARPADIVFVSGGTEGDHLALVGAARARRGAGRTVAVAAIEHHAVHGAAEVLEEQGWSHVVVPCDGEGRTRVDAIDALPADTTVLSAMLANNETGVVQPLAELAARARARGILVHCDAVQAAGKVAIDVAALGADYVVISGHKFGGPKGAGALWVRPGAALEPLARGSAHERGRRAGTENVPGIVGLGVAAAHAGADLAEESARLTVLRERFEHGLHAISADVAIHGGARRGCPTPSTPRSPARAATTCCSRSTRMAWPPPRGRRAPAARSTLRPCWPRWASRARWRSARCAFRSGAPPRPTTSSAPSRRSRVRCAPRATSPAGAGG